MAVFSAVTYGTAASVANLVLVEAGSATEFDAGLFLVGWAFVFFTQLVAHFLGTGSIVVCAKCAYVSPYHILRTSYNTAITEKEAVWYLHYHPDPGIDVVHHPPWGILIQTSTAC